MKIARMAEVDFTSLTSGKTYTPSPAAWEDQVFYFLMVDRFSNGKESNYRDNSGALVTEGSTPLFTLNQASNISREEWVRNGQGWKGGNLKGLIGKLGYLQRMGITALWVSPIFKQVNFLETYHGYGIQNFLELDPHFGTKKELVTLVEQAHELGIYVILDIILNHTGNVFTYNPDRYPVVGKNYYDPRWDGNLYEVAGFNDANGKATVPFRAEATSNPDEAVFPLELQDPATFTRKGRINSWDYNPEFLEGDFCDLKDVRHGSGPDDHYVPSRALEVLAAAYKYWIALADVDGFRVDTVKHMEIGATRYFASVIHEFTQSLGKERFFLIGEITGGRENAFKTLEESGLDAALGIDEVPDKLEYMVKGYRNPEEYFNLFRNSTLVGKESHTWFRNKVVTLFDDHDQVRKGNRKGRFCADNEGWKVLLNVLAVNALTLGVPCIYYGSEQYFNGHATEDRDGNDVFLRECMFGGDYGALQTQGYHFFNEESHAYVEFAKILAVRRREIALRRGRQYLREISGDGMYFGLPRMMGGQIRSVVPWSRILDQQEVVAAINTDYNNARTAWVTVDSGLHNLNRPFVCLYSTDSSQIGSEVKTATRNGKAVQLTVPAAGCVIYKAV
ncbi:MAG: alpha-amylase family glycosyl hydrolase [Candidatus Electronema sp. V4]|uniref:alpha-amylase family glycosyl hydrolase n=1 Tax=Candidatus Electronema sp. V4 TaxID=3454756 RepID=UPI0040553CAE